MSEAKFTPGPWNIDKDEAIIVSTKVSVQIIAMLGDVVNDFGSEWNDSAVTSEVRANASLISSAPDMYKSGKEMAEAVALLPCDDGRILGLLPILCRLRAAIAKAEGRHE